MNELVRKAFSAYKKLQKLDESDFAAQVEYQKMIFMYLLEMTEEQLNEYSLKCDEFLEKNNK